VRTPQRTRIVAAPPESRIHNALARIDVEIAKLTGLGNLEAVDALLDVRLDLTATVEVPR
jgi:hypothetical protein